MENTTQNRRCPLWVKILLGLSLAGNLAIVGLVAGFMLRGGPSGARVPAMGYAMPYVLALPRDLRRDVFTQMRADDSLPDRRSRRAEYRNMVAALQASPFDEAAVRAVLDRQSDGASRVQRAAQEAWIKAVSGLSDAERVEYTKRMEEAVNRRGPRKKDDR